MVINFELMWGKYSKFAGKNKTLNLKYNIAYLRIFCTEKVKNVKFFLSLAFDEYHCFKVILFLNTYFQRK